MNWRRYREALLLRGERPGIRVVRLIHRDSVWMNLYRQTLGRMAHDITVLFTTLSPVGRRSYPDVLLLQQLNSVSIVLKRHGPCCPALALPGGLALSLLTGHKTLVYLWSILVLTAVWTGVRVIPAAFVLSQAI